MIPFTGSSRTITETNKEATPSSLEQKPSLFQRWMKGKSKEPLELSEAIDVNENIDSFKQLKMKNFKPEMLYQQGLWNPNVKFIRTSIEESLTVGDNDNIVIPLVSKETVRKIKEQKEYVHLGLILFGIKRMHRGQLGTKVLAIIFDDRFKDPAHSLLAQMEIDMNQQVSLFYCAPDFFLKSKDLGHIKLGIQSQGYGPINTDNIQITRGLLGKGTQNSSIHYRCNISDVIEAISSKGCKFIQPPTFNGDQLAGNAWDVTKLLSPTTEAIIPDKASVYTNSNGETTIRFSQYHTNKPTSSDTSNFNLGDDEDD